MLSISFMKDIMQQIKLEKNMIIAKDQDSIRKVRVPFATPSVAIPNKVLIEAKANESVLESCSTVSSSTQQLRPVGSITKERAKNDQKLLSSLQDS